MYELLRYMKLFWGVKPVVGTLLVQRLAARRRSQGDQSIREVSGLCGIWR